MDGTCFRYTHPSLLPITLFKYLEQIVKKRYIYIYINTVCFKNNFAVVFQNLLCSECYGNLCTQRRTNYPLFKILNDKVNWKKFSHHIRSRTRDLPACSIVAYPLRYRVPPCFQTRLKQFITRGACERVLRSLAGQLKFGYTLAANSQTASLSMFDFCGSACVHRRHRCVGLMNSMLFHSMHYITYKY
jgi:hypothetical protein